MNHYTITLEHIIYIQCSNSSIVSSSASCRVVCDSLRPHGLSGSSVHGILQARILEWVAVPLLQGSLPDPGIKPGSPALQADSLPSEPLRKPLYFNIFFFFLKQKCRKQDPRNCLSSRVINCQQRAGDRYLRLCGPQNLHYSYSVILGR